MDNWLNLVRGLIRPVLTLAIICVLLALAFILALKFANEDLSKTLVVFLTGAGTMALGYWFGERKVGK